MDKAIRIGFIALITVLYMGTTAQAKKRLDIMVMNNGYPSGPYYTLNIQGENPNAYRCQTKANGNTVYISENEKFSLKMV